MKQEKLWDYFQTEGIEVFADSIPRLTFLLHQAQGYLRKSGVSKPQVLNIGVGNGWLESQCVTKGWNTYSLDPSQVAIKKLEENGFLGKVGSIEAIPYDDNLFDVVFCSEVLEHLSGEQIQLGLKEINRVLVKGGYLIGTVPFNENLLANQAICPDCGKIFHRWGHQQSFTQASLSQILSQYFFIKKIKIIYCVSWSSLNWKGKVEAVIKKIISKLGIHGKNETLFFVVKT